MAEKEEIKEEEVVKEVEEEELESVTGGGKRVKKPKHFLNGFDEN